MFHEQATSENTIILFVWPPKFCVSIVCSLLGPFKVPRATGNNAYAKFGGPNKEYYGISRRGYSRVACHPSENINRLPFKKLSQEMEML